MPQFEAHRFVVGICNGSGPATTVITIPVKTVVGSEREADHGKAAADCAYTGLHMSAIAAADPFLLALAFVFLLDLGVQNGTALSSVRSPFLRPPLRGPPVSAV